MMDHLIVWTGRHNSDNFSCSVKFSIKKIKLLQLLYNCFPYRSVSTGRLSEQPVRITLGGQTYQGSTDSLNMERPMDTGQSVHCSEISFILVFYFCVSLDMNLQSNQQRFFFFFFWSPCRSKRVGADWFSKSTDGPLHRGLAAQQQHSPYVQSSGHTAPHDIRWGTAFFSIGALICVTYLILNTQMLFIPLISGLQQFSRLTVFHQRPGLRWLSSWYGHRLVPSWGVCWRPHHSRKWGSPQQPALCPLRDVPSQPGGIHHVRGPGTPRGDTHGGEQKLLICLELFTSSK